jgi:hypothetical protein
LRIVQTGCAGDLRGGGNANHGDKRGSGNRCPGAGFGWDAGDDQRPEKDGGDRSPGAGAGLETAGAEESCDQSGPERGWGAGRRFGKLRAGSRDSRRGAGATVAGFGRLFQCDLSSSSGVRSGIPSSASGTGDEIT